VAIGGNTNARPTRANAAQYPNETHAADLALYGCATVYLMRKDCEVMRSAVHENDLYLTIFGGGVHRRGNLLEARIVGNISKALSWSVVLSALVAAACGDQPQEQLGATASALELPIVDCQTAQATCLIGAKSPQDALQCNSTFGKCLLDAGPKLVGIDLAVADCQIKAQQCVLKGGVSAVAGCRTQFEACVNGAGDSDDAGVAMPTQPGAGSFPGLPGLPGSNGGRPTFPGFPGMNGMSPGLPGAGSAPGASCFSALNACVRGGTRPADCATQARKCLGGQGAAGAAAPSAGAGAGGAPSEFRTP
jgi:hypothetical protein